MYINHALLESLYKHEKLITVNGLDVYVQRDPTGPLVVIDGSFVLADPYALNYGIRISTEGIPDGEYNTWLYSAIDPESGDRTQMAFSVCFNDEAAESFTMCIPPSVDPEQIEENGYFGAPTQSGNLSVMAEKTCLWLMENQEAAREVLDAIEEEISASYFEIGGLANISLPEMKANIVTAAIRGESGVYPAYWALNAEKEVVGMIIDFIVEDII